MHALDWIAWGTALPTFTGLGLALWHDAHLPELPEEAPASGAPVCLLIPARDEGREIFAAVSSWLAQDHGPLRLVVVDDGSTDATPEVLRTLAAAHPDRLAVLRNDHLPEGWLGKNHALHLAQAHPWARAAAWLLLADADVQAEPGLLRRALAFAEGQPTDVLALLPAIDTGSAGERLALPLAAAGFLVLVPPHKVPDPRSFAFCGVGAFTLIRRSAYDALGGHAAAPLEAIDDMMLARRAKVAGFVNRVARGGPMLHLRMYHGLWSVIRAMRKNAMALPLWPLAPLGLAATLLTFLAPLWLPFAGHPALALLLWLLVPALLGHVAQRTSRRPMDLLWALWPLLGPPLALGQAWAFWDRLRGINHWRGRSVKLDGPRAR
ncbi:MAG TPA: glycosyltransferase family 2 protein [Holophagaceae bacterium]|nr:glycosyltransferase family 2 protein [Holophagaceae bacterium]